MISTIGRWRKLHHFEKCKGEMRCDRARLIIILISLILPGISLDSNNGESDVFYLLRQSNFYFRTA